MYDAIFLSGSTITPYKQQFFNSDERLYQTIETYESIKNKIPNSFCILIEGSRLTDEQRNYLNECYDVILEYGNDADILNYTTNINIGIGEMKLLQKGIEYIKKNNISSKYLFKLGGRYTLSNNFNLNNFKINKYTFRPEICMNMEVYNTGLYNIPINKINDFYIILEKGIRLLYGNYPIERVYVELIDKKDIELLHIIGLEGRLSYNGNFFSK